jgi:hypothetical protein
MGLRLIGTDRSVMAPPFQRSSSPAWAWPINPGEDDPEYF